MSCGFDRPRLSTAVDRFCTDFEYVVDDVFICPVKRAAARNPLSLAYCIDSTDVMAMPADLDAPKCYDPTEDEYYYRYGCVIASAGQRIPIATEFTGGKPSRKERIVRVTHDVLAVKHPIWMVGDSAYDTLGWHDHLLATGVVPIAPYNAETLTIRMTSTTGSKTTSPSTVWKYN